MYKEQFKDNFDIQPRRLCNPYIITKDDIESIPCKRIMDNGGVLDKKIQEIHKRILYLSMSKNNNGEVGALLSLDTLSVHYIKGDSIFIDTNLDKIYSSMMYSSKPLSLMFLHNHPNNSVFSYADLLSFLSNPKMLLLSVVCNNGNLHVLQKLGNYDYSGVLVEYNRRVSKNNGVNYILNNDSKFGLKYSFGRRRK